VTESTQETCHQFCIAAKCCSAPVITNLELSGVILSPNGVYTNASSGEHVLTNCQASNSKNVQLCTQYQAFCSTDEVTVGEGVSSTAPSLPPTQVAVSSTNVPAPAVSTPVLPPSQSPASMGPISFNTSISYQPTEALGSTNNQTVSMGNSSSIASEDPLTSVPGSLAPSQSNVSSSTSPPYIQGSNVTIAANTSTPVIVPPPPYQEMQEACASNEASLLISTGDAQAISRCLLACQEGLCCFANQLGYEGINSCYDGNEQVCTEYSLCLILQGKDVNKTSVVDEVDDNSTALIVPDTISNETSTEGLMDDNSTTLMVPDTISNETSTEGLMEDLTSNYTVNENSTVIMAPQEATSDNNATIVTTSDSNATFVNTTDSVQIFGPPIPEQDLSILCSEVSISQTVGLKECMKACDLGICCTATDGTGCYAANIEICNLYTHCNNAYSLLYSD
jgi:hypothetical protein